MSLGGVGQPARLGSECTERRQSLHTHHTGIIGDGGAHPQFQRAALGVIGKDGRKESVLFGAHQGSGTIPSSAV